ncbi:hypothetical protein ABVT39_010864 [Epinephelus coioides]
MGQKYADIYLAHWEKTAFNKLSTKPLLYFWYLDDIFGLWDNTWDEFLTFINTLNSHHPKIKLKHKHLTLTVEFLDTQVFFRVSGNQNKTLIATLYFTSPVTTPGIRTDV